MRICIVNNLYKPYNRGGTERVIELAVDELVKSHQLLLLTTSPEDKKNCLHDGNLKFCRFNPRNVYHILDDHKMPKFKKLFWHFFDLFIFKSKKEFRAEISDFKPDIIITHNLKGFSMQIPKVIRKFKIPHIHVLHDYQLIDPHSSLYRNSQNLAKIGPFLAVYKYFTNRLIKSPNLVISPSKFVLDKHLEYGFFKKSKTAVLCNPISNHVAHNTYHVSDKLRILYLGQIESHKGVDFLVKTFLMLNGSKSELKIVGNGSQIDNVKQAAKSDKRIEVVGKVEADKINEIFNQTDVLIVPSIWWDNSPTVIYEAYSQRVPVLVSDSGGSKELVKENQTGWIFKSNNENDLLKKLKHLEVIKEDLKDYGENGYEFVQQFYADKYVDKLLELCQSLKK